MSDSRAGDRSSGGPLPSTAAPQVSPTEPLPTPEGSTAVIGGYLDGLLPGCGWAGRPSFAKGAGQREVGR